MLYWIDLLAIDFRVLSKLLKSSWRVLIPSGEAAAISCINFFFIKLILNGSNKIEPKPSFNRLI
jgi:hypothetical protein